MKKVVKILVEKANVNAITSANRTLLMYAARYGQIEVTWWLQMITIMECLTQGYCIIFTSVVTQSCGLLR